LGGKLVAVADHSTGIYNNKGLDASALAEYVKKHKCIKGFPGAEGEFPGKDIITYDVDILLPCALENAVTSANAEGIKAKIVCEGANGPTTPEADSIMNEKGIIVIPDILANCGGVTVSYFEWVQNLQRYSWSFEEIQRKQEAMMIEAFDEIWALKEEHKTTLRTAAYMISIKRVAEAMKLRGWY
ncbi:MAG TPA: glutamate dehydrogenase, partial [Clostridia bacterium]|nr:glutamate dehydrogenase [Clostridia bacterium]